MSDEPTFPPDYNAGPSTPPPIPAGPLQYARPMPPQIQSGKPNFFQQAAKASWIAPVIAISLNVCATSTRHDPSLGNSDKYVKLTLGFVNAGLIVLGFAFGITALCGIRRYGKYKILVPAIVGVCLNGFSLAAIGVFLTFLVSARRPVAARSAAMPTRAPVTAQEAQDSLAKAPGWVGITTRSGAVIVVASVGSDTPLGKEISDLFGTDRRVMDIVVNNAGGTETVAISSADFSVVLKDGSTHAALSPQAVFNSARFDATTLKTEYPPAASVPARSSGESSVAAFLPASVDPAQIDYAIIIVNGKSLKVPGKFQTAEEKAANIARSQKTGTSPSDITNGTP